MVRWPSEWPPEGTGVAQEFEIVELEDLKELVESVEVGSCLVGVEEVVERTVPGEAGELAAILDAEVVTGEDHSTVILVESCLGWACRGCFVVCWERSWSPGTGTEEQPNCSMIAVIHPCG